MAAPAYSPAGTQAGTVAGAEAAGALLSPGAEEGWLVVPPQPARRPAQRDRESASAITFFILILLFL